MTALAIVLALFAGGIIVAWTAAHFLWRGENLSIYDGSQHRYMESFSAAASREHSEIVEHVRSLTGEVRKGGLRQWKANFRRVMEHLGDAANLQDIDLHRAVIDGTSGEWVVARGADPARRMLYIHGGAFIAGSPYSHRTITTALSRACRMAVLAVDYRLIPEHRRLDGLHDCQTAYRWMLHNGPDGAGAPSNVVVAGDSAGGNLALAIAAWSRDEGIRTADAVVALGPATDGTLCGPSGRANRLTDYALGDSLGPLVALPVILRLWLTRIAGHVSPCDPRVSPLHGDLQALPPTLVQASEHEMLLDDARRYVNKAVTAGSPARLQTWPHMIHVWHIFEPKLPEARDAIAQIARFVDSVAPRGG